MNKRVSAMGEMLRFRLDLPLEEKVTGFQMLSIEMTDGLKVYTLKKDTQVIVLALPAQDESDLQSYEKSIWFARVSSDTPVKDNIAARIDIKKTNETYKTGNEKNEEISHEINHYTLNIVQDPTYLPEDTERSLLPETETVNIDIELHYSSKYAQNSATTLNIQADVQQGDSKLLITAKVKTAAQWRFMPFEITDPVYTGTDFESILKPYLTDWISAAPSAIRYQKENTETATENIESSLPEVENQDRSADEDDKNAETAALEEPDQ